MSVSHYYAVCTQNIGKAVEIRDIHGKVYTGVIERVDHQTVYLRTIDGAPPPSHPGGYGTFLWGPGFAAGALVGVGLASIAALAFLPWVWI